MMSMTITYPQSRSNATNCSVCMGNGQMQDDGFVLISSDNDSKHRLLKRTCGYCGFTIFFDPSIAKKALYTGAHEEIFPDY